MKKKIIKSKSTEQEREEFIESLKAWGKRVAKSKYLAKKLLRDAGIITKSGKLSKHYKNLQIPFPDFNLVKDLSKRKK